MRSSYLLPAVLIVVGSGCSVQKPAKPASTLFRDYSLASVVDGMKLPELQSVSGGEGESESFGATVRRRRDFYGTYKIYEGSKFDETKFIGQLKDQIEKLVRTANLRVSGSGSSNENFHVDYSDPGHVGSVEVFGTRAEGNLFKLWSVIRESTESPD